MTRTVVIQHSQQEAAGRTLEGSESNYQQEAKERGEQYQKELLNTTRPTAPIAQHTNQYPIPMANLAAETGEVTGPVCTSMQLK
jgi:hypothetical protein